MVPSPIAAKKNAKTNQSKLHSHSTKHNKQPHGISGSDPSVAFAVDLHTGIDVSHLSDPFGISSIKPQLPMGEFSSRALTHQHLKLHERAYQPKGRNKNATPGTQTPEQDRKLEAARSLGINLTTAFEGVLLDRDEGLIPMERLLVEDAPITTAQRRTMQCRNMHKN